MQVIAGETTVDDVDATLDRIRDLAATHEVTAQAFDARRVAGRAHLLLATRCALRARAHDDMIADDLAVEILCYAAGRRQIGEALALGLTPGDGPVVVAVVQPDRSPASLQASGDDPGAMEGERVAAAAIAEELNLACATADRTDRTHRTDPLLAPTDHDRLQRTFDISDAEREATDAPLAALVRERTALLAVTK